MYESLVQQLRGQIVFMLDRIGHIPAQERAAVIQALIQPFQKELALIQQTQETPFIEEVKDAKPSESQSASNESKVSDGEGVQNIPDKDQAKEDGV